MGWVSAFSAFGRFSVTLPTRPFRSRMNLVAHGRSAPVYCRRILRGSPDFSTESPFASRLWQPTPIPGRNIGENFGPKAQSRMSTNPGNARNRPTQASIAS